MQNFTKYAKFTSILVLAAQLSACASSGEQNWNKRAACLLIGVAAGAAIGTAVDDSNEEVGLAVGAVGGGVAGTVLCDAWHGRIASMSSEPERMVADGDSDGDGVKDSADLCPNTDPKFEVDAQGCPKITDQDGDGVDDDRDRCPDTPIGSKVDSHGCPEVGEAMAVLENIHFAFDKAQLMPGAQPILDQVVRTLNQQSNVRLSIEGHTDNVGTDSYNQGLGLARAQSVRMYLMSAGIMASRIQVRSFGESQPIADNSSTAGRSKNRRVEFIILEK